MSVSSSITSNHSPLADTPAVAPPEPQRLEPQRPDQQARLQLAASIGSLPRDPLIERLAGALAQSEPARPSLAAALSSATPRPAPAVRPITMAHPPQAPATPIIPRAAVTTPRVGLPALPLAATDFDDDEDDAPITLPTAWRRDLVPVSSAGGGAAQVRAGLMGFGAGLVLVVPLAFYLASRSSETAPRLETAAASAAALPSPADTIRSSTAQAAPKAAAEEAADAGRAIQVPVARVAPVVVTAPVEPPATLQIVTRPVTLATSAPAIPPPPAAAPAPAAAAVVAPPPAPFAEALEEATRLVASGKISDARTALGKAAASGSAQAQFQLAETYDPNMLAVWGARDARADPSAARALYTMALGAGVARARQRLDALN